MERRDSAAQCGCILPGFHPAFAGFRPGCEGLPSLNISDF
jgi:hypothetical protein